MKEKINIKFALVIFCSIISYPLVMHAEHQKENWGKEYKQHYLSVELDLEDFNEWQKSQVSCLALDNKVLLEKSNEAAGSIMTFGCFSQTIVSGITKKEGGPTRSPIKGPWGIFLDFPVDVKTSYFVSEDSLQLKAGPWRPPLQIPSPVKGPWGLVPYSDMGFDYYVVSKTNRSPASPVKGPLGPRKPPKSPKPTVISVAPLEAIARQ